MRKIILITALLLSAVGLYSQEITLTGRVLDSDHKPLQGAAIKVVSETEIMKGVSDSLGRFTFKILSNKQYIVTCKYLGLKPYNRIIKIGTHTAAFKVSDIMMRPDNLLLQDVVVQARKRVLLKKDTVQFNTEGYTRFKESMLRDILKRLPGVRLDGNSINAHGMVVNKIRVNGKDFADTDISSVLNKIPAELIDNIQIINDYGDLANFSGIKTGGYQKILNVNFKSIKNRFGHISGGLGTNDRYNAEAAGTKINGSKSLTASVSLNNTNNGTSGSGNLESIGNYDGLSSSRNYSLGIVDSLGKVAISVSGRSNDNYRSQASRIHRKNVYPDYTIDNFENAFSSSDRKTYEGNSMIDYLVTKRSLLRIKGSYSETESTSFNDNEILTQNDTQIRDLKYFSDIEDHSNNLNTEATFTHRFAKNGRNFTAFYSHLVVDGTIKKRTFLDTANETLYQDNPQRNKNNSIGLRFVEPVSKRSSLAINYQRSSENATNTFLSDLYNSKGDLLPDSMLNGGYTSKFHIDKVGIIFNYAIKKIQISTGAEYLTTSIEGEQQQGELRTNKQLNRLVPTIRVNYGLKNTMFMLNYTGIPQAPTIQQLQPVRDLANIQNVIIGNPDLKQEFNHNIMVQGNYVNASNGLSVFSGLGLSIAENKIVANRISIPLETLQETRFTNINGVWGVRGFYAINLPFSDKSNFTYSGSYNHLKNVNVLNNIPDKGNNCVLTQSIQTFLEVRRTLDIEGQINYNRSVASYTAQKISTITQTINFRSELKKKFGRINAFFSADKNFNVGYQGEGQNPFLINVGLEELFFKGGNGSVRLTAFDLLNQNIGVSRSVIANNIIDSNTSRLKRYFLLSLSYRIKNVFD